MTTYKHHAPFAKRIDGKIRRTLRRAAIARKAVFLSTNQEIGQ